MKSDKVLFCISMGFLVTCGANDNQLGQTSRSKQELKRVGSFISATDGSVNKIQTSITDEQWADGYMNSNRAYLQKGEEVYAFVRQKADGSTDEGKICNGDIYFPPNGYVTLVDNESNSGSSLKVYNCDGEGPKAQSWFKDPAERVTVHNLAADGYGYLEIEDVEEVPGTGHAWYKIYSARDSGSTYYDGDIWESGYLCRDNVAKPNKTMFVSGRINYNAGAWDTISQWIPNNLALDNYDNQIISFSCKLPTTDCLVGGTVPSLMDASPTAGQDCSYKVCTFGNSCSDNCTSGYETDSECGPASSGCERCEVTKHCNNDADCGSGSCISNTCRKVPRGHECRHDSDCEEFEGFCSPYFSGENEEPGVKGGDGYTVIGRKCTPRHCGTWEITDGEETDQVSADGKLFNCGGAAWGNAGDGCVKCPNGKRVAVYDSGGNQIKSKFQPSCASGTSSNGFCRVATCDNYSQTNDWFGTLDETIADCDNLDPGGSSGAAVNDGDYACGWCSAPGYRHDDFEVFGTTGNYYYQHYHGQCHQGAGIVSTNVDGAVTRWTLRCN